MQIKYNNPELPQGYSVMVEGLGELINGEAVEFDEDALTLFGIVKGMPVDQAVATIPYTEQWAAKAFAPAPVEPVVETPPQEPVVEDSKEGGE